MPQFSFGDNIARPSSDGALSRASSLEAGSFLPPSAESLSIQREVQTLNQAEASRAAAPYLSSMRIDYGVDNPTQPNNPGQGDETARRPGSEEKPNPSEPPAKPEEQQTKPEQPVKPGDQPAKKPEAPEETERQRKPTKRSGGHRKGSGRKRGGRKGGKGGGSKGGGKRSGKRHGKGGPESKHSHKDNEDQEEEDVEDAEGEIEAPALPEASG